ncbi:MAG: hypothetical protein ABSA82_10505 [Thermacetogeniaceae bacterium]
MKKGILYGIVALVVIGLIIGGCIFFQRQKKEAQIKQHGQQLQAQVVAETRIGEVAAVTADRLTMQVSAGGNDAGKTLDLNTTGATKVQIGNGTINKTGDKVDLTKWFKAGDIVMALDVNGNARLLARTLRQGEAQPAIIQ